jgi:hypothetical protein
MAGNAKHAARCPILRSTTNSFAARRAMIQNRTSLPFVLPAMPKLINLESDKDVQNQPPLSTILAIVSIKTEGSRTRSYPSPSCGG